jgi:Integrase core domain
MKEKHTRTQAIAALKAGMNRKTAAKYLKKGKLPTELKKDRDWKTRSDAFEPVWPELQSMLESAPGLEAKTLLEWLMERDGGEIFHGGQLRTLQRRVRDWRATCGREQEVMFPQDIQPGRQSQSDYTHMDSLGIRVAGEAFPHLLFHFILPYSRWEAVMVCYSESFDSLTAGYSAAVWELGSVPPEHRTDNLSAATHRFENSRAFNQRWDQFMAHHGAQPSRNNPGKGHENGSIEKSHDLLKKDIRQQLLLRSSRDFTTLSDYESFLSKIMQRRNKNRKVKLEEELEKFLPLPMQRWDAVRTLSVTVGPSSTISVLKGIYSVPSRLIGYGLSVDVHSDYLEVRYGSKIIETIPRLANDLGSKINYRHIIGYLVRKPGAFAHYQYRDSLFPKVIFRQAYDVLVEKSAACGHKDYLKVLHLAAMNGEAEVAAALEILLEAKKIPYPGDVKQLLDLPSVGMPTVQVTPPKLSSYDALLSTFTNSQGVPHVIH